MPDEPDVPPPPPGVPAEPDVPPPPPGVPAARPDRPPPVAPAGQPATPTAASAPVQELLAAGFTHRDHEENALGFAAGGPLDKMEPGPVLAGFAGDAVDDGLAVLDDDALVGLLCAARRLSAWTASIELRAVSHLSGRRAAYAAATGDRRQADHVGDEVAAALTLTCRAADRLVSLAAGVTRLPAAAAALAAGRIDMPRAIVFTDELAGLGDVAAAAVAALVAPDAAGLTTSELRRMLHRAVLALDPEAATKRREKAQRDARVEVWAEPAGTAALAGRDMPPAEVLAADKHIDATARDLKAAGAEGTLEQLRARVFLTLLSGQPIYTLLPGQDRGTSTVSADGRSADGRSADSLYDPPGNDPNADDHAGDYLGRGDHGRGNHDGGNHDGGDHDGGDHGADGDGDNPGRPGPGGARRPGPGRGPGPSGGNTGSPAALTGSVNLTVPLMTWLGLTGQPGEAAGHGPLDATACRDLTAVIAAGPGSRWCLTITSPDGTAVGHGCAETAHPPPRGPAPPGVGPPGQRAGPGSTGPPGSSEPPGGASDDGRIPWLAGIKINWLETGACGHARETFAYQPSRALRHLIKTRNRTCTFPGCRRPAIRCDDDHTVPFDQGGRTCECNISPLCRRHHGAKQAPGWHLDQPRPGVLTWTLPSGRTHTTRPAPYPA
jgi:hypothetical protein